MITNGTAAQENYYLVNFANGGETYVYGLTALDAIHAAYLEIGDEPRPRMGAATARRAVYKEWVNETWRYRNDGGFIRGPRTVN